MAKLNGTWRFNDVLTRPSAEMRQSIYYSIRTTVNDVVYEAVGDYFQLYRGNDENPACYLIYGAEDVSNTVYENAWSTEFGEGVRTVSFTEEQEVSAEFYEWFMSNAEPVMASIQYNGQTIAYLVAGQKATLLCAGKKALTDIVVEFETDGNILYNSIQTDAAAGKTATLKCAGEKMLTDVVVTV